jgi:hypothetical protein
MKDKYLETLTRVAKQQKNTHKENKMDIADTLQERHEEYGDFRTSAKIAQHLKGAIRSHGENLNATQLEAMSAIMVKISRLLNGDANSKDGWRDIAGYAMLAHEEIVDNEQLQVDAV